MKTDLDTLSLKDLKALQAKVSEKIATYEDRFVSPTSHKELVENSFDDKSSCGFTFGNGCSGGSSEESLFGKRNGTPIVFHRFRRDIEETRDKGAR